MKNYKRLVVLGMVGPDGSFCETRTDGVIRPHPSSKALDCNGVYDLVEYFQNGDEYGSYAVPVIRLASVEMFTVLNDSVDGDVWRHTKACKNIKQVYPDSDVIGLLDLVRLCDEKGIDTVINAALGSDAKRTVDPRLSNNTQSSKPASSGVKRMSLFD